MIEPTAQRWLGGVEIFSTDDLRHSRHVVLLGEPGMGKSHILLQNSPLIPSDSEVFETVSVNLAEYGEQRLVSDVLNSPAVQEWIASDTKQLYLELDSLDEGIAMVPQMSAILASHFRNWPLERLWLRIACRTARFPANLEAQVRRYREGTDLAIVELLPLTQEDASELALLWGGDGSTIDAISARGCGPLAARPLTLKLLVESAHANGGQLAESAQLIYAGGLLALAAERDDRYSPQGAQMTPEQRLAVARRVAASTVFSGQAAINLASTTSTTAGPITPQAIAGDCEPIPGTGDTIQVTPASVSETLATALFAGRGQALVGWGHATFADYLAADWIHVNALDQRRCDSLLTDGDGNVYPQARATAAWLAAIDPDRHGHYISNDVLGFTGEVEIPSHGLRRLIVRNLLSNAPRLDISYHADFTKLKYSGLAADLVPALTGNDRHAKRLAIAMSRQCRLIETRTELAMISISDHEPLANRIAAGYALLDLPSTSNHAELVQLLETPQHHEDIYGELLGLALLAAWPKHIASARALQVLEAHQPRRLYGGSLDHFMDKYAQQGSGRDICAGLDWCGRHLQDDRTEEFRSNLVSRAVSEFESPGIVDALAELCTKLASQHLALVSPIFAPELASTFVHNVAARRAIASRLIESHPDQLVLLAMRTASHNYGLGLVRDDDLGWIIDLAQSNTDSVTSTNLATLFDWTFRRNNEEHVQLASQISNDSPLCSAAHAALAVVHTPERESRQPAETTNDAVAEWLMNALSDAESGDIPRYWEAMRFLNVPPGAKRYRDEHVDDIGKLTRWQSLTATTRRRFLDLALPYLQNPVAEETEDWLSAGRTWHPGAAAYRAMVLLHRERPTALEVVDPSAWRAWAAAIVAFFPAIDQASMDAKEAILRIALRHARQELRAALDVVIQAAAEGGQPITRRLECRELWSPSLEGKLVALTLGERNFQTRSGAFDILARESPARALGLAIDCLSSPSARDDPFLPLAFQHALRAGDETAGAAVVALFEGDNELARTLLDDPTFDMFSVPDFSVEQLGRIYAWLSRYYPWSEDPDDEDSHLVTPRMAIGQWRSRVLESIIRSESPESASVIMSLAERFPDQHWLPAAASRASEMSLFRSWTPLDIPQLIRLRERRERRIVRTEQQLLTVVLEGLQEAEARLQGAPPQAQFLWDTFSRRPKEEDALSDFLSLVLAETLASRGIVVNREVQVRRSGSGAGERVDIHVAAVDRHDDTRLTVVVEVKGAWNGALRSSLRTQLVDRYLRDVRSRHGVYCVGWYDPSDWAATCHGQRDRRRSAVTSLSRAALEDVLHEEAADVARSGFTVACVVLDASLRRPVGDLVEG